MLLAAALRYCQGRWHILTAESKTNQIEREIAIALGMGGFVTNSHNWRYRIYLLNI